MGSKYYLYFRLMLPIRRRRNSTTAYFRCSFNFIVNPLYEGSDELVLRKEDDSQNLPPREYMAILCDKTVCGYINTMETVIFANSNKFFFQLQSGICAQGR